MTLPSRELHTLYLVLFLTVAGFGVVFPLLPLLIVDLGASSLHMGLLVSLYALCQFLFAPLWGNVSDRYGRKPVLIAGLLGFSFSFVLMGLAQTVVALLAARVLGGLLSAAAIPTAQAYVADATPPHRRGAAMGRMGAAIGTGFMVGPVLGAGLSVLGLRAGFFFTAGLCLLTAMLAGLLVRESASAGSGTAAAARRPSSLAALRYAVGSPHAILFWLAFVVTFSGSSLFSMVGLYLADRFAGGGVLTGAAFTVMGAATAAVQGLLVGPAIDRLGEHGTIFAGLATGVAAFAALGFAGSLISVLAAITGTAAALSLVRPTVAAAVSKRTRFGQGITMGIQTSFDSLGRVLGPLFAGAVYAWSPQIPFLAAAGLYLLALAAARLQIGVLREAPAPLR